MPETLLKKAAERSRQRSAEEEDVLVDVTDFFGGRSRARGRVVAVAACPKCLGMDDKAVTRAFAGE